MTSTLERTLAFQIQAAGLPAPEREFLAIPGRRFRWDFAWRSQRLLVEVQGGAWKKGGHTSGTGINRDTEKLNLATLHGWRSLAFTTNQIREGKALAWIQEALKVAA